jgi:hypothetical protein
MATSPRQAGVSPAGSTVVPALVAPPDAGWSGCTRSTGWHLGSKHPKGITPTSAAPLDPTSVGARNAETSSPVHQPAAVRAGALGCFDDAPCEGDGGEVGLVIHRPAGLQGLLGALGEGVQQRILKPGSTASPSSSRCLTVGNVACIGARSSVVRCRSRAPPVTSRSPRRHGPGVACAAIRRSTSDVWRNQSAAFHPSRGVAFRSVVRASFAPAKER